MSIDPTSKRDIQISKALSYLLRHGALKEKLDIDKDGYIALDDILSHNRIKSHRATFEDIKRIVDSNDKQRFTLRRGHDGDGEHKKYYICANQGHSIESVTQDEQLILLSKKSQFPKIIVHGTYTSKLLLILQSGGLSKMSRNHIHFAIGLPNEEKVISGIRQNCDVLIYLDIDKLLNSNEQNIKFFMSKNNVVLSEGNEQGIIPVEFFAKICDRNGNIIMIP
ncbi:hypothetical protein PACTADRAFT_50752 [Pachysolen tannophilus NRRL Y-2460]|uniref:2'-phosphotransferase n=1 Tax=Pachysolen tannophilus NRRL Y-2460 TaxID=669874 RepID=A0A1E4TT00_PACTA|nr:hypothetical protein PACTADRAFT_50752 [Pachysolen tannophilus NRRL Y-2460]